MLAFPVDAGLLTVNVGLLEMNAGLSKVHISFQLVKVELLVSEWHPFSRVIQTYYQWM